ncbi:zinc knuckle CX2CX4HX4C containing protein [Tanacetum coccineum]
MLGRSMVIERAIYRNGFFFFKFSSHDGMIKTLEGGPWFIRSSPIFLYKWSANTKLKKEAVTRVPVWVRIHNVPVVAFSEVGLSLIATQLGRPIRLDVCTSDMCLNPWGHTSYARVLVEFNSENEVMESIVVLFLCLRIFNHEDYDCPLLNKHAKVVSSSREGGIRDTDGMHKKKGTNKAVKSTQVKKVYKTSIVSTFRKAREASTSKHISSMSDSDESEVEEVCMPYVIPGGGFLNGLEDGLERYDGYEARLYDLSEQEQAFCD